MAQRRHKKNDSLESIFAANRALLPSDVIDFAILLARRLLAGNSFIVRCNDHVTSKKPMRAHSAGEKAQKGKKFAKFCSTEQFLFKS